MKNAFAFAIILLAVLTVQAQKIKLGLNLEEGKEYHQNTNAKMLINQTVQGMEMNITTSIQGKMTYKVTEKQADQYEMDVWYESLKMEMETPQGKMAFNSKDANPEDMMSTLLSKMINKPFQVKMTKAGKLSEVKNIDAMFANLFEGFPLSEQQKQQVTMQLKQSYGEKAFKGNLEIATAIYPDTKVAVGDQWTIVTDLEAGMSGTLTTQYELKENASDAYLIHGEGKMKNKENGAYQKQNGMDIRVELSGDMVSDIKIDKKSGWIKEATIKQKLAGNTHMKGNEQMPDGMTIPMKMNSEMTITN